MLFRGHKEGLGWLGFCSTMSPLVHWHLRSSVKFVHQAAWKNHCLDKECQYSEWDCSQRSLSLLNQPGGSQLERQSRFLLRRDAFPLESLGVFSATRAQGAHV